MTVKDKIVQTIIDIRPQLEEIASEFYIIGASAMILSGVDIGDTSDIDILTTESNATKLSYLLKTYLDFNPETKDDDLFQSNFSRLKLPLKDVEVMGDLRVKNNHAWQPVCVQAYREISIEGFLVKIPTLEEQKRILSLFGRDKDRMRIQVLNPYLR